MAGVTSSINLSIKKTYKIFYLIKIVLLNASMEFIGIVCLVY